MKTPTSAPSFYTEYPSQGTVVPHHDSTRMEVAYTSYRLDKIAKRGSSVAISISFVMVLYILGTLTFNSSGKGLDQVRLAIESTLMTAYAMYAIALRKLPHSAAKIYEAFTFITMYVFCAVHGLTNDRLAALMALDDGEWKPGIMNEAKTVGAVVAALAVNAAFIRPHPRSVLLLVHTSTLTYVISLAALGSLESQCMVNEYDLISTPVKSQIGQGVLVYVVGILMWASRRSQDQHEREIFLQSFQMEQELLRKQQKEIALRIKLDELDQLNKALHAAGKLSITGLAPEGANAGKSATCATEKTKEGVGISSAQVCDLKVPLPMVFSKTAEQIPMIEHAPNAELVRIMAGRSADFDRIRCMAERIEDLDYKLSDFFQDCIASFPELALFTESRKVNLSSGRSAEVEYQRTIGALFAVYWLMRLHGDGPVSFCYGVDGEWMPCKPAAKTRPLSLMAYQENKSFFHMSDDEKKENFFVRTDWSMLENLVENAGCKKSSHGSTERIMALLCLTAFHDIMKVETLLPTVQEEHAPHKGFAAGAEIHDHDLALSYVLEQYPHLLPSFAGLPPDQKRTIIFTQSKMNFNHGWFVQAEGPPGAMLSNFKAVLQGNVSQSDIAFYFLHWFTDLSGAEATPLGGSQKFVLKFPHNVLASFLWSMPFLEDLALKNETTVVQNYLEARLKALSPDCSIAQDRAAIACMRLAIMTQSDLSVIDSFRSLPAVNQRILETEFACTGCADQTFESHPVQTGPAFLLYYAPAVLQRNSNSLDDLQHAVLALSYVFHAARAVWPAQRGMQGVNVTIQVGQLKSHDISTIMSCPSDDTRRVWILLKQNELEGSVELRRASALNELYSSGQCFYLIDFGAELQIHSTDDRAPFTSRASLTKL